MDDSTRESGSSAAAGEGNTALAERRDAELDPRGVHAQPPERLVPLRLGQPKTAPAASTVDSSSLAMNARTGGFTAKRKLSVVNGKASGLGMPSGPAPTYTPAS